MLGPPTKKNDPLSQHPFESKPLTDLLGNDLHSESLSTISLFQKNAPSKVETEKGLGKPNTRQQLKKKISFDKKPTLRTWIVHKSKKDNVESPQKIRREKVERID